MSMTGIVRLFVCAGLVLLSSLLPASVSAQAPLSFDSICSPNPPSRTVGPADLHPGRYFNPRRSGQGWDFFWYGDLTSNAAGQSVQNRLFVIWYTHEHQPGSGVDGEMVPVWFGAVGDLVWGPTSQERSWNGTLYRFRQQSVPRAGATAASDTFRQWLAGGGSSSGTTAESVGSVALFFGSQGLGVGGRPNQVAAAWQLSDTYRAPPGTQVPTTQTADCLTNFMVESAGNTPDQSSTGVYLEDNASGVIWTPIYWTRGGVSFEHHGFAYFDRAGDPRWLVGHPSQPPGSNHACADFFNAYNVSLPGRHRHPAWWIDAGSQNVMCMARVGFSRAGATGPYYAPWNLDRQYYESVAASMQIRRSGPTSAPRASVSIGSLGEWFGMGSTAGADGVLRRPTVWSPSSDQGLYADFRKVFGLTRALLLDNAPNATGDATCLLRSGNVDTAGACDLTTHWMTEGSYLNLTVKLKRFDTLTRVTDSIEISRGLMRSPVSGLSIPAATAGRPSPRVLACENVFVQVTESPDSQVTVAQTPTRESTCVGSLACGLDVLSADPAVALAVTSSGGLQATVSYPAGSGIPLAYRIKLYDTENFPQHAQWRYVSETSVPFSSSAAVHVFSNVTAGRQYAVVVDAYNSCARRTRVSSPITATIPEMADQNLDLAPQLLTGDANVGSIPLNTAVSGGAATWDLPIEVPPGIQGVQPSLSVTYSSRAGNGIAGMGTSLSGASSIHRCPATLATDGHPRAVDFSLGDRLCLDGQRLIEIASVAGQSRYGLAGTQYRTEIDQYLRVTQVGGDLASIGAAASFLVETRGGDVLHYGDVAADTANATSLVTFPESSQSYALAWNLRRRANRAGNFIEYRYTVQGAGERLLSTIRYSGIGSSAATGGTSGNREVRLAYESRPDPSSTYVAGARVDQTRRLQAIETHVGGVLARRYAFTYGSASSSSGRSLLRDVSLCVAGSESSGAISACLPATTLSWQEAPAPRTVRRLGLDAGIPGQVAMTLDEIYAPNHRDANGNPTPPTEYFEPLADFDGDGTLEYLYHFIIPNRPETLRARLINLGADRTSASALSIAAPDAELALKSSASDLNNDGRADLWIPTQLGNANLPCATDDGCALAVMQWRPGATWPSGTAPQPLSAVFDRSAILFEEENGLPGVGVSVPVPKSSSRRWFVDATGDGLPDLFLVNWPTGLNDGSQTNCPQVQRYGDPQGPLVAGPEIRVYENRSRDGAVRFAAALMARECLLRDADQVGFDQKYFARELVEVSDLNGDGIPDIAYRRNQRFSGSSRDISVKFGISVPAGPSRAVYSIGTPRDFNELFADRNVATVGAKDVPTLDGARFVDINGDGLRDIHIVRSCKRDGVSRDFVDLVSLNTGRAESRQLFDRFVGPAADRGSSFRLQDCLEPLGTQFPGPDFSAFSDVDADGRDELLRPTSFALRQCVFIFESRRRQGPLRAGEPVQFWSCPENPRGIGMPPGDPVLPGLDPIFDDMYQRGYSAWDRSIYYASATRLQVDTSVNPPVLRTVSIPGSVITDARGSLLLDLYGDGLSDSLLNHGCPLLPVQGVDQCLVRYRARDNAGNPIIGPHGLYVEENRGVSGNPADARTAQRAPLLPDLLWEVRAAAPIDITGAATRIARWSYDPLSSRAGRTSSGDLPLYALPTARVAPANHFYFTSSMPVVSWFQQSNGNLEVTAGAQRHGFTHSVYGYREALYSAEGRGFRGFRAIVEEVDGLPPNDSTPVAPGLRTTTLYKQMFPLSSAVDCQFVNSVVDQVPALEDATGYLNCPAAAPASGQSGGANLLSFSRATTVPILRQCSGAPSPQCYWDVQSRGSESTTYDPLSGWNVRIDSTSNTFDTFGNVTSSVKNSTQTDAFKRTASSTERITRTVSPVESPGWFVTRTTRETVERESAYSGYGHPFVKPADRVQASTTTFLYDFDPTTGGGTRQVNCASSYLGSAVPTAACDSTSSDPNWLNTHEVWGRDQVGNSTWARTLFRESSASGSTAVRARSEFSDWGFGDGTTALDAGYFQQLSKNARGHSVCTSYDKRFGSPKVVSRLMLPSQTCANPAGALVETITYDGFGREIARVAPSATEVGQPIRIAQDQSVVRQWCNAARCSLAPFALYREIRQQRGSPRSESYVDAAGRAAVSGVVRFGASSTDQPVLALNYSVLVHDDLGRRTSERGPFNSAETFGPWTDFTYDRFGRLRVKQQIRSRLDGVSSAHQRLVTAYAPDRATTSISVKACTSSSVVLTPDLAVPFSCTALPSNTGIGEISMSRVMDQAGRPLETVDAKSGTTVFMYDGGGNALTITDPAGVVTRATYDHAGRRRSVQDPNQGASSFEYSGLGELVERTDARGFRTVYNRDNLGRVMTRTWAEDVGALNPGLRNYGIDRFDYDANGFGLLWRESRTVFASSNPAGIDPANPPADAQRAAWFQRQYTFDPLYRVTTTTTQMQRPGSSSGTVPESVGVSTRYDRSTGRVKQRIWPQGVNVGMEYTPLGYLHRERLPNGTVYREIMRHDNFGTETEVRLADGTLKRRQFVDSRSGLTTSVCYQPGTSWTDCLAGALVNVGYSYDAFGNVSQQAQRGVRPGGSSPVIETFTYDELHRMRSASGAVDALYDYQSTGNITKKTDYSANIAAAYAYGDTARASLDRAGPNAVKSVQLPGGGLMQYRYDASGNMVARDCPNCGTNGARHIQWIDYTIDNLPKRLQSVSELPAQVGQYPSGASSSLASDFWYGPDGQRYAQFIKMGNPSRSTIYVGEYERDEVIGSTSPYIEHRYAVAPGVLVVRRESGSAGGTPAQRSGTYYVLRDRLGSSTNVIKVDGTVIAPEANEQHGYGPFGEPRTADWTNPPKRTFYPLGNNEDLLDPAVTRRGFTQHEHLDRHSLIHMNGRLYDYLLGRFLGVDPIVQFPTNSQSLNPYSYILNNPLSGTDPTGYASAEEVPTQMCERHPSICGDVRTTAPWGPGIADGSDNGAQSGNGARGSEASAAPIAQHSIGSVGSRAVLNSPSVGPTPELSAFENILDFLLGDTLALFNNDVNPFSGHILLPGEKIDAKMGVLLTAAPIGGLAAGAGSKSMGRVGSSAVREVTRHTVWGAIRGMYNNVAGRLRGDLLTRVDVPRGVFGTTDYGVEMHYAVGDWVVREFARYGPRIARGSEKGIDIVFERGVPPGWQRSNELKPLTTSGLGRKLDDQIERWRRNGTLGRDEPLGVLAYDEYGNVFLQPPR